MSAWWTSRLILPASMPPSAGSGGGTAGTPATCSGGSVDGWTMSWEDPAYGVAGGIPRPLNLVKPSTSGGWSALNGTARFPCGPK